MTSQTLNLNAAWIGALAGLALVRQPGGKTIPAAIVAALLVLNRSRSKQHRPLTLTLSGVLGFACTTITASLVS